MTTDLPRRPLGTSGLMVSAVGLGGNTFGPPRLDEEGTRRVVAAALDLGVNFVDTAVVYGGGESEVLLGKALRGHRDEMVIATKCNFFGLGDEPAPDRVRRHADESLRKLGTDRLDLLQVHFPNDDVADEDLLGALDQLVRAGKVLALGACNYASWRLAEARLVAASLGSAGFASVQNYHHVLARPSAAEVLAYCRRRGIGFLPYHPLGGGFLTGKYTKGAPPPPGTRGAAGSPIIGAMGTDENWEKLDRLIAFAGERGQTVGALAIAWLLADDAVSSVIAGVSNPDQLAANVAAAAWTLSAAEVEAVDAIVGGPPPGPEDSPYGRAP